MLIVKGNTLQGAMAGDRVAVVHWADHRLGSVPKITEQVVKKVGREYAVIGPEGRPSGADRRYRLLNGMEAPTNDMSPERIAFRDRALYEKAARRDEQWGQIRRIAEQFHEPPESLSDELLSELHSRMRDVLLTGA